MHLRTEIIQEKADKKLYPLLWKSLSQAKLLNDRSVSFDILVLKIRKQAAALTYHCKQTSAAVVILLMRLKMLIKVIDALGKKSDLYLGRARIGIVQLVSGNDLRLCSLIHHNKPPL